MAVPTATRKRRLLYKSKVEYTTDPGVYACNHVVGCPHGCVYCYAAKMSSRFNHTTAEQWHRPHLVENWRELLERDLAIKRKEPIRRVFMCFMSDPFPYGTRNDGTREIRETSVEIIRTLNAHDIPVTTLSKGLYPRLDLYDLHPENEYGITITTLNDAKAKALEPWAAPPRLRLTNLIHLACHDCRTWLSIEPFGLVHPNPSRAEDSHAGLEQILWLSNFVDRIVFGRANYCRDAYKGDAWYASCAEMVEEVCKVHEIDCIIKKGTPHEKA